MGIKSTIDLTREDAENQYVAQYMDRANLESFARAEAKALSNGQLEERLERFSDIRAGGVGFDNFLIVSGGPDDEETDRPVTNAEDFYDHEIAPILAVVGSRCQANGMSICTAVEYAHGEVGQTSALVPGRSFSLTLVEAAIRANGNVDTLLMALMKHGRESGHSSIFLHRLGVPTTPGHRSDDHS